MAVAKKPNQQKYQNTSKRVKNLMGLSVAIVAFILYIQTSNYSYNLDDFATIKNNFLVQRGTKAVGELLHTSYWHGYKEGFGNLYRPASLILFAIEWQISPDNPGFYHLMNVLWYALLAFALFKFLSRLFPNNNFIPLVTTLLFVAHPAHTEVVANIKSRDEILCFLFSILSLSYIIDYYDKRKPLHLMLCIICFYIALISKQNAITLIPVVPLIFYVFKSFTFRKAITTAWPFAIATLVYFVVVQSLFKGVINNEGIIQLDNVLISAPDYVIRFATAFYVLGRYLLLLVFPLSMSMNYSYPEITLVHLSSYKAFVPLLIYSALFIYAIINIRKRDIISFGILYLLFTIFIFSNLVVMIGTIMADRLLFMPSLGFCLILATLLFKIPKNFAWTSVAVVFVLFVVRTEARTPVWKDMNSLYTSGIHDSPNSARTHYLIGSYYKLQADMNLKDSAERAAYYLHAINEFKVATNLYPAYFDPWTDMGRSWQKLGDTVQAMQYYKHALALWPTDAKAATYMANLYYEQHKIPESRQIIEDVVARNPHYSDALKTLAKCCGSMGDPDKADYYLHEALKYETDQSKKENILNIIDQNNKLMGK